MESYNVSIKQIEKITQDVLRILVQKPIGYLFEPGQATEIAINKPGWREEKRPFTFTNLPQDEFLEFIIKTYPSHNGVTNEFLKLKAGDELLIHDVWGAIAYRGKGLFIAGGTGITPFLSIFRNLYKQRALMGNRLIFCNKTQNDIIQVSELHELLGENFFSLLSEEYANGHDFGFIDKDYLGKFILDSIEAYYVCGPPPMMDAVMKTLCSLGINEQAVVMEM